MKLLARREHSARELAAKLEARGHDAEDVAVALSELQSKSLQSDARFCESYVHHRIERGYGPLRIRHELEQRGVERTLIAATLDALDPDWSARLAEVRRARFGPHLPRDRNERARQMRFLAQRGFQADAIRRLFRGGERE
jgi:regulatory protein